MLHCNEDAPYEDEDLPRQDDSAIVSRTFQKFGSYAIDGQKRDEFFHPDERRNHENEEGDSERVEHVAKEFPTAFFVASDFVARKNGDEDDGEESRTDHVIQNVWNHEGEVEGVFFERHASGVGEEHFAENAEHAAYEHANGDNNGSFIHGCVKYRML